MAEKKKEPAAGPVSGTVARNRKALHDFEVLERLEAGLALQGTEVKVVRAGHAGLQGAYAQIDKNTGEAWLCGVNIPPYGFGNIFNHDSLRARKLLLHRKEILKIEQKMKEKGLTIVPLSLYINEDGRAKIEIALARGKKLYDKRDDIAKKDAARRMQRERRR